MASPPRAGVGCFGEPSPSEAGCLYPALALVVHRAELQLTDHAACSASVAGDHNCGDVTVSPPEPAAAAAAAHSVAGTTSSWPALLSHNSSLAHYLARLWPTLLLHHSVLHARFGSPGRLPLPPLLLPEPPAHIIQQ